VTTAHYVICAFQLDACKKVVLSPMPVCSGACCLSGSLCFYSLVIAMFSISCRISYEKKKTQFVIIQKITVAIWPCNILLNDGNTA